MKKSIIYPKRTKSQPIHRLSLVSNDEHLSNIKNTESNTNLTQVERKNIPAYLKTLKVNVDVLKYRTINEEANEMRLQNLDLPLTSKSFYLTEQSDHDQKGTT